MLSKDRSKVDDFSTQKKWGLSPIIFAMGLTGAALFVYLGLHVPFNNELTPDRDKP